MAVQDGGDDFAAIMMPERQDLMNQWGTVQNAWDQVGLWRVDI